MEEIKDVVLKKYDDYEEGFLVDNQDKAEWVIAKIVESQKRIDDKISRAKEFKQRIEAWLDNIIATDERNIERLKEKLKPYVSTLIASQEKKSVNTIVGTVGYRKSPDKLVFENEDMLLKRLEKNHPEAVKIKKSISKTEIKKLLKNKKISIECAELITMTQGENRFYVSPNKADAPW